MKSVPLENLKKILCEEGFTILGHGTGSNNINSIPSIFHEGLRASHTSIFYTTEGLAVDENLIDFKNTLDHWKHLDSENIILIKLPNEFFNIIGDSIDLECERTGAFVNEKIDEQGKINYYLDPKFIIGAYNRNVSKVILNPNFEYSLSEKFLKEMQEKLAKAIAKTQEKNKRFEEYYKSNNEKVRNPSIQSPLLNDLNDFEWDDDIPKRK